MHIFKFVEKFNFSFIDGGEIINKEFYNGITIGTSNILKGIQELGRNDDFILIICKQAKKVIAKYLPNFKTYVIGEFLSPIFDLTKGKKSGMKMYHSTKLFAREIDRLKLDMIWYPYYTASYANKYQKTYSVYTINDLIPLHRKGKNTWKKSKVEIFRNNLKKRCSIVTISNFVKKDVIKTFGIVEQKISVIEDPIIPDFSINKKPIWLKYNYILDINAYSKHKNTITLIKAFEKIGESDLHLICTGAWIEGSYLDKLKKYIEKKGLSNKIHLLYRIPVEEKNYLLLNANNKQKIQIEDFNVLNQIKALIIKHYY